MRVCVYCLGVTELSDLAKGKSGDQQLSVPQLSAGSSQHLLSCCSPTAGPHWQQGAYLSDWSVQERMVSFSESVLLV